jgi:hypothetical protein
MRPDFVVIRSRRALMSWSHLAAEQAELAERIYQALKQAADSDLRGLAELLASKPDRLYWDDRSSIPLLQRGHRSSG